MGLSQIDKFIYIYIFSYIWIIRIIPGFYLDHSS